MVKQRYQILTPDRTVILFSYVLHDPYMDGTDEHHLSSFIRESLNISEKIYGLGAEIVVRRSLIDI